MKTIHDIKEEQQDRQTALFKECGLFFAFSEAQFIENKTPLQEGEKYVSIGAGGYLPKSKIKQFADGMKDIEKWYKIECKATKEMKRQHIAYELANYECYYTGDISAALSVLPYPKKDVVNVYMEERKKWAEDNN